MTALSLRSLGMTSSSLRSLGMTGLELRSLGMVPCIVCSSLHVYHRKML
jgi:hypothetical protein